MSEQQPGPRIRIVKNGPYMVDGPVPIAKQVIETDGAGESVAWREDERLSVKASCALCRCGSSNIKPYCDGTHRVIAFDGTETASTTPYAEAATRLEGPAMALMDDLELCAEARFCSAKGAVWHLLEHEDEESCRTVVAESDLCPSGRYTAIDPQTGEPHEPVLEPSIGIVEDPSASVSGPVWVRGGIPIVGAEGTEYEIRNRVTLCRCGSSKNKPFCDGTHVEIGFDDAE